MRSVSQMPRLHVKKHEKETKEDEKIDLDEKIRRIREENKARERRFKEIEDDKLKASDGNLHSRNSTSPKEDTHGDSQKKTSMLVLNTDERKAPKGRGQRLREMSQQPLKAEAFERKACQGFSKMLEKNIDSQQGKDFTDHSMSMMNKKYTPYQRRLNEEKKMSHTTDIPSVGHNPLMDDRYDVNRGKPRTRTRERMTEKGRGKKNHSGFGGWSKMDVEGKQSENPKQVKKSERQKEFLSSRKMPAKGEDEIVFSEDWSSEIMDINDYKVGSVSENMSKVPKEAFQDDLHGGNEEVKELGLPNDDKETCHDKLKSEPIRDEIPQICEKLQDHCQLPDTVEEGKEDSTEVQKMVTPQAGKVIQAMEEECCAKATAEPEPHEHKFLKEEKSPAVEETKSSAKSKKDNKPKMTINNKLKKTTSTSSLDENLSMLSPLDVPKNWGDCDFDDEILKPITF